MSVYNVIAVNNILQGKTIEDVRDSLRRMLQLTEGQINAVLSRPKTTLQKSADKASADKTLRLINLCGLEGEMIEIDLENHAGVFLSRSAAKLTES